MVVGGLVAVVVFGCLGGFGVVRNSNETCDSGASFLIATSAQL